MRDYVGRRHAGAKRHRLPSLHDSRKHARRVREGWHLAFWALVVVVSSSTPEDVVSGHTVIAIWARRRVF